MHHYPLYTQALRLGFHLKGQQYPPHLSNLQNGGCWAWISSSTSTSTSKDRLTSSRMLMRSSTRTEREDGRERVGQPQHNPNLHLSSLRDPTDRIAPPALVHLRSPASFHI
ncbi:hypothetical protein LguiA_015034 [Lonicera macranthoides]